MRLCIPLLLALFVSSCTPAAKCGPSTCNGCCDAAGACMTGGSNLVCGQSGATCAVCSLGETCLLGQCSSSNSGGGSGGGTGGGNGGGGSVTGGGGGVTGGGSGGGVTGGGGGATLIPNVMLLVDTSGSMILPIDAANPNCPSGCGDVASNPCPANCPTRMSELRSSVGNWLASRGSTLRLGLTTYPSGIVCEPAMATTVPLPAPTADDVGTTSALQANAAQIAVQLQSKSPGGGTPTGASLTFLTTQTGLTAADGRADYVVLLTDGLPNCNANNPNGLCSCGTSCTSQQTMACQCTTSFCSGALCSWGCLDGSGAVSAVSTLAAAGIKTVVVGFGADTASATAQTVLDGMARVGGAPRSCPNGTSAECGPGGTCLSNRTCSSAYYQASSGAALEAILDQLF